MASDDNNPMSTVNDFSTLSLQSNPDVNPSGFHNNIVAPTLDFNPSAPPPAITQSPSPVSNQTSNLGTNVGTFGTTGQSGISPPTAEQNAEILKQQIADNKVATDKAKANSDKKKRISDAFANAGKAFGDMKEQAPIVTQAPALFHPVALPQMQYHPTPQFQPQIIQPYVGQQMVSDETKKTNIDNEDNNLRSLLDTIKPYSWDYKEPEKHGVGRFTGVMAQDLQKSEIGKQIVLPQSDGTLAVDTKRMASTAIAASALMYKEQKQLRSLINKLNEKLKK